MASTPDSRMKPGSALAMILGPAPRPAPPIDLSAIEDAQARRALSDIAATYPHQAQTLAQALIRKQEQQP